MTNYAWYGNLLLLEEQREVIDVEAEEVTDEDDGRTEDNH